MAIEIKETDFPVYQQLVKNGAPGCDSAITAFNAASAGGDDEQYHFALGIQTIAANLPAGSIPGITDEMNKQTLRSCMAIFKSVAGGASAKAEAAQFMVQNFTQRRLGL
jgi:hypothetical protein